MPRLQSGAMLASARVVNWQGNTLRSAYGIMRVDSGDDVAIVIPSLLSAIGAQPVSQTDVEGIDGRPLTVYKYKVDVDLGPMGYLTGVEALGLDISSLGYAGLIGDNLLDSGILLRNGPAQTWNFMATGAPPRPNYSVPLAIAGVGLAAVVAAAILPRRRRTG